jgi:hypothetical protein
MQPDPQKSYRSGETSITTPTKIRAMLLVMCRLLPLNNALLFKYVLSRWDVVERKRKERIT